MTTATASPAPSAAPPKKRRTVELAPGRATGPRTGRGKSKARTNALTHGIFAEAVAPWGESREEFDALWNGLRASCQPAGRLEELLVEKLAVLAWRTRRFLRAEAAEIDLATRAIRERDRDPTRDAIAIALGSGSTGLLMDAFLHRDPVRLGRALDAFKQLKEKIQKDGLDWDRDRTTLMLLGGWNEKKERWTLAGDKQEPPDPEPCSLLAGTYRALLEAARDGKDPRARKELAEELDHQIRLFEPLYEQWVLAAADRRDLELVAAQVPTGEAAERLQRYEASLERAFDRTLGQLERVQRQRLGQPVPPMVQVQLSR